MSGRFYSEKEIQGMIVQHNAEFEGILEEREAIPIDDLKSKNALNVIMESIHEIKQDGDKPVLFIDKDDYSAFCLKAAFSKSDLVYKMCQIQRLYETGYVGTFEGYPVYSDIHIKRKLARILDQSYVVAMPREDSPSKSKQTSPVNQSATS